MQLDALRPTFERPGPFVSVHVEVGRTTEDARQQAQVRWNNVRQVLERDDVPEGTVEHIGDHVTALPEVSGEARLTLVATRDEILFSDVQAGHCPWPEHAETGVLPDLSGWLRQSDQQLPFGLAVADRSGADIEFFRARSKHADEHRDVQGETFHIQKVPEGDWGQKEFQQTAENVWKRNAAEVAEVIHSGVRRHRPRVVVIAGEERARAEVAEAVGETVETVEIEAGGRGPGASHDALWAAVEEVLARYEAVHEQGLVDRLRAGGGQAGAVADGLDQVVDALTLGRVAELALDLETAREASTQVTAASGLALPEGAFGVVVPADRLLVAAAALTDGSVSLVPREHSGLSGISALLRWDGTTAGSDTQTQAG